MPNQPRKAVAFALGFLLAALLPAAPVTAAETTVVTAGVQYGWADTDARADPATTELHPASANIRARFFNSDGLYGSFGVGSSVVRKKLWNGSTDHTDVAVQWSLRLGWSGPHLPGDMTVFGAYDWAQPSRNAVDADRVGVGVWLPLGYNTKISFLTSVAVDDFVRDYSNDDGAAWGVEGALLHNAGPVTLEFGFASRRHDSGVRFGIGRSWRTAL